MKVGIFVNAIKDKERLLSNKIINILKKYNIEYSLYMANDDDSEICKCFFREIDFAIVLGGDGTMLHATREIAIHGVAIFGVNIGNLGFLTEVDYSNFEYGIQMILNKKYFIEKRLLLTCDIESYYKNIIAVNDICMISESQGKIVTVKLSVNGDYIDTFAGDGIIVSTPTGSTGYSLSAGGPIVSPKANCMILTPICAHSLTAKPMVVCKDDIIEIQVAKNLGLLVIDGQRKISVNQKKVSIKCSDIIAKYIRLDDYNFYNVLSKKFNNSIKIN